MIRRRQNSPRSESTSKRDRGSSRRKLLVQNLEARQLLAGDLPIDQGPNNIGVIPAFQYVEQEGVGEFGVNDIFSTAEPIPLGTGAGQEEAVDIQGTATIRFNGANAPAFTTDVDVYEVQLRKGDILDIAVQGAAGTIDVYFGELANDPEIRGPVPRDFSYFVGSNQNQAAFYPINSPLQTIGNAAVSRVVPFTGSYYIQVTPTLNTNSYTAGLRTYRPVAESLPIGQTPILYLDFHGEVITQNDLPGGGVPGVGTIFIPEFGETMGDLLPDAFVDLRTGQLIQSAVDDAIDSVVATITSQFDYISEVGNNGDYFEDGISGNYGIQVLNSKDHPEFENDPRALKLIMGGESALIGGALGVSQTLDIGNFTLNEKVFITLDDTLGAVQGIPIAANRTIVDLYTTTLGGIASHEAGHAQGMRHTRNDNFLLSLTDAGGNIDSVIGLGTDGIFGTFDDIPVQFFNDQFNEEGLIGRQYMIEEFSNVLVSGINGTALGGGVVFQDNNGNGVRDNEPGLAGITVFADLDGDGIQDPSEPVAVTNAAGTYNLSIPAGTSVPIIVLPPDGFTPTTPTSQPNSGNSSPTFGLRQINPDVTGTTFIDENGNGVFDASEGRLGDVFIYADLDGDNRPDLGEPNVKTDANGEYSLDLAGPGTYTIRAVVPPGFEQTTPDASQDFEVTVNFDGTNFDNAADFGFLASQDFGDAPATYGTAVTSHGILPTLTLGSLIDREGSAAITTDATGDDNTGNDDEDGFQQLTPIAPGAAATFRVTANNDSNQVAYVNIFFDINRDGDFNDAGENIVSDGVIPAASGTGNYDYTVNVPATASLGDSFARVRLSTTPGIGATGFVATGEVEDYAVTISETAGLANDDELSVPRNSLAFPLDVLANDFVTPTNDLTITNVETNFGGSTTQGFVTIAADGRSIFYTPPTGFSGETSFIYTVQDAAGNLDSARVDLQVQFQSLTPIAIDDIFTVPENSSNRPLNVLDNDLASIFGGISIISVSSGSSGGQVQIVGGGQSLRYTPQPGFNGSEQFLYSIQDGQGNVDTATVTVNLSPGIPLDDEVEFTFEFLNAVDETALPGSVRAGETFKVRVLVDDIAFGRLTQGVASAFLDVLYTDALLNVVTTNVDGVITPNIEFGSVFPGSSGSGNSFSNFDVSIPGILNEIGATQDLSSTTLESFDGAVELFTIEMFAVGPGTAVFAGDPADDVTSETILINEDEIVTFDRQRLGRAELLITPRTDTFTAAVDDSFPDGRDSNGNLISVQNGAILDVLDNDQLGPTGDLIEFGIITQPSLGTVTIDDNNTPDDLRDDFLRYQPRPNETGLDSFRYVIATSDGVRSIANVTLPIGNPQTDVELTFNLVDEAGNDIDEVAVGTRFGVEVFGEVTRLGTVQEIFAAYQDVMYSSDLIVPSDTITNDIFNFDVEFEPAFDFTGNFSGGSPGSPVSGNASSGDASVPGIINEFGSFNGDDADLSNPTKIATLFFEAVDGGTAVVVGGPVELFPDHDTLIRGEDDPITVDRILYDRLSFQVIGSGSQNQFNRFDVNNDGNETPFDALLVLNHIARQQSGGEGESGRGDDDNRFYTDVNGDQKTTPLDALQVLNRLRRTKNGSGGEGESVASALGGPISIDSLTVARRVESEVQTLDRILVEEQSSDDLMGLSDEVLGHVCEAIDMPQVDDADDRDVIDESLLSLLSDQE